ncbi:MAG: hypothetical protein ACXVH1_20600 [Solirubrobacteraceae bacterium]
MAAADNDRVVLALPHRTHAQTHRPDCFIPNTRWPDLGWVEMRPADVPAGYRPCGFCGGGIVGR